MRCDQSVPDGFGGTEPRITCNAYLTTQRKAWDVLSDFWSAMLWLSEISHHFRGDSYCYGGGYYRRHRNYRCGTVLPEHGTGRRAGGLGTVGQPAGGP